MSSAALSFASRLHFGLFWFVLAFIVIKWLIKEPWRRGRVGSLVGALLAYAWFHAFIDAYMPWWWWVMLGLGVVNFKDIYDQVCWLQKHPHVLTECGTIFGVAFLYLMLCISFVVCVWRS